MSKYATKYTKCFNKILIFLNNLNIHFDMQND